MTEEKALEFWRLLPPGLDAVVAREHEMGPNDPVTYEVRVNPLDLRGGGFAEVVKLAEANGLWMSLELERQPWLTFYSPEPEPVHPAAPKA